MSEKRIKRDEKVYKMRCGVFFIHYLHKIVAMVARVIFSFVYSEKKKIPPVTNPLLLDSVMSLAEKIRTKKITSVELINAYIERIKEINPVVNCFVEDRFSDALEEGKNADSLVASGKMTIEQLAKEKPLLGVPFTTKDCIMVKDLHHTSGLVMRRDEVAKEDAESLSLLRKAGAIPIGLTNVSELCMWWESHNRLHGRTNNPYNTSRGVGGSSGGEGCMQASAGSAFGIGSDIGGSIRMPAFFNGVFGHKPSKFIVSNHGQFPVPASEYQASFLGIGPITRKASDLLPIFEIMAGDNASKLKLKEKVDVKDIKVFYQQNNLNSPLVSRVEPAIRSAMMKAVQHMNTVCDAQVKEMKIQKLAKSSPIWLANMKIKDSVSFAERITGKDGCLHIVIELVKSIFGQSDNTLIGLVTALFEKGGVQPGTKKHEYYVELRQQLEDEFTEFLGTDGVFLYPTHPTAALYHNEPLIRAVNFSYTSIINVLGLPATHIPMGLDDEGLPIGIQVVSNLNNDRYCLAVAQELEKAFGGWVEPSADKKEA